MFAGGRVVPVCFVALGLGFIVVPVEAATRTAANCSSAEVQKTINAAKTDDSVVVPSGNCFWSAPVNIPSTKRITLRGAGMDATVVTGSGWVRTQPPAVGREGHRVRVH